MEEEDRGQLRLPASVTLPLARGAVPLPGSFERRRRLLPYERSSSDSDADFQRGTYVPQQAERGLCTVGAVGEASPHGLANMARRHRDLLRCGKICAHPALRVYCSLYRAPAEILRSGPEPPRTCVNLDILLNIHSSCPTKSLFVREQDTHISINKSLEIHGGVVSPKALQFFLDHSFKPAAAAPI